MEENEFGLPVGLDHVYEIHGIRSLDAGLAGVDLKGEFVFGAHLAESPHDEILEVLDFGGGEDGGAFAEDFFCAFAGDVFEMEGALIGEGGLEADGVIVFGGEEEMVENLEVVIERFDGEAVLLGEDIGAVGIGGGFGGMETADEGGNIEDEDFPRVEGFEFEAGPVGIIEHQFDVGLFGDDFVEPFLIFVVFKDTAVEFAGLIIGDGVEVDAVERLEGDGLIAVKAGGASVLEIVSGFGPPGIEFHSLFPRGEGVVPGVIAVAPKSGEVHPLALFRFVVTGEFIEGLEVIVGVDGGDFVEGFAEGAVSFGEAGSLC